MNSSYITGVIISVMIVVLTTFFGWWLGFEKGRRKGFYEGWDDGCNYTEKELRNEFNRAYPSPFRKSQLDAQRSYLPRPDSAGPIRAHKVKIRGDHRLPVNNPDKREPDKPPNPYIVREGDI